MLKRWLIAVFTIGILLLLHVEQVSAYVHHQVEVDQETREALKKSMGWMHRPIRTPPVIYCQATGEQASTLSWIGIN
ncbi:hypothetical protein ABGV42_24795 [Paenibacillus pabuli]|uniref:hypothetical protein n=1 Tax=Paenibacillus pabuli TaxID=1472 RepID=UPI003241D610